ncbi:hypothetical protein LTS17_012161 [Exophiala oligosperma]
MSNNSQNDLGVTETKVVHHPQEVDDAAADAKDNLGVIGIDEFRNLKRTLSMLGIVVVSFDLTNSWIGIATSLAIAIALGGTVTLLYGVILVSVTFLTNGATLAELASVYPTAGGQYHFTSILAPSSILLAVVIQFTEDYTPETWHYFLLYQAINIMVLLYNVYLIKKTTWIYDIGSISSPKQSSSSVWTIFENNSGWSDGISFLTGTSTPQYMFVGIDASLHLAEECLDAARIVPKAVMSVVGIGFVTAFAYAIAVSYSLNDLATIILTKTGFPTYELWIQATRSEAAATVFMAALMVAMPIRLNAMQQTTSRLTWALARDDALILSTYLSRVHPDLNVPVQALLFNAAVVLLTGCLYMASTTGKSSDSVAGMEDFQTKTRASYEGLS